MKFFLTLAFLSVALHADELQVDPDANFSIVVPSVLLPCELKAGSLACPAQSPALTIQTKDVSSGASVELMALNGEDVLRKKPNYRLVKKEKVAIDETPTIVQTMTFNNLGNVTLPVVVREIDAVVGNKAIELEVACNQSTCPQLLGAFDRAIGSFHLAAKGQKLRTNSSASPGLGDLLGNFKF